MGRLSLKFDGCLAEQCNPLEGPLQEILPSVWSGPHVLVRTSDAFATIARMPRGAWAPSEIRGLWPTHNEEWQDVLAQLGNNGDVESTWEQKNRVIVRASSVEITGMEKSFGRRWTTLLSSMSWRVREPPDSVPEPHPHRLEGAF